MAEIAAAISVVGSLIFVGIQLRQSTAATVVGNTQAMVQVRTTLAMAFATDKDLAEEQLKSMHPDVVPFVTYDVGRTQFGTWIMATFRSTEVWFLQWRDGQLAEELWHGNREAMKRQFSTNQFVSEYWVNNKNVFSLGFQQEVEDIQREGI